MVSLLGCQNCTVFSRERRPISLNSFGNGLVKSTETVPKSIQSDKKSKKKTERSEEEEPLRSLFNFSNPSHMVGDSFVSHIPFQFDFFFG